MKKRILFICLALLILLPAVIQAEVRSKQEPGVSYTGLSSDSKPTTFQGETVKPGALFYETDKGTNWVFNGTSWILQYTSSVGDSTALSVPGNTTAIYCRGYNIGGYLFNIANINTSVTLILQGKVASSKWTAVEKDSTVYVGNGSKGLISSDIAIYDSLRLNWYSEAGGTAATLTNTYSTLAKE